MNPEVLNLQTLPSKFLPYPNLKRLFEGPFVLWSEVIDFHSMNPFSVAGSKSHINVANETNAEHPSSSRHKKVLARWDPDNPKRPDIGEAPVFYPLLEEFEDTLAYIEKIRPLAESYGICRIVPPPKWSPSCRLLEQSIWGHTKFPTRIQNLELLQNREPMNKKKKPKGRKTKRKRNSRMASSSKRPASVSSTKEEKFGFNTGSSFTLEEFEKYATYFRDSYFNRENAVGDVTWAPSIQEIEGEYWRIIEDPTDDVEVYYGADLENGYLGSGFNTGVEKLSGNSDTDQYLTSGWNLNNLSRIPGSVFAFESSDISGVVVPWVYVGMCLSSFCWHVEDHHLYSMNYNHFGAPKVWYGVPGSHATALEKAMRKHLRDLFKETPDLLHGLVTQFSPSILKKEGVPVYRLVQRPGEYVITFPRAYHSGFNCGFNCAEAVNFAPVDWLSHGQKAVELYSNEKRKTSLSHDRLLIGAAYEAVKSLCEISPQDNTKTFRWKSFCGKKGELTKAVEVRLQIEERRIKALGNGIRFVEMDKGFDSVSERECTLCLSDLHLFASGCNQCFPGEYACMKHLLELCSCGGNNRFILLRHTIDELNSLVRALEGESDDLKTWLRKVIQDDSETRKEESGLVIAEPKKPRTDDFDLNVEFQLDDEFDTCSETIHFESKETFSANIEPINLGLLSCGKLWCNKHAIFPKGFKSRVRFYNVQDPTRISNYISEIVDGGFLGPLFRVTLEECPEESFSNVSVQKCWEMVLERVNEEIQNRSSQEDDLHTLKSIDGLRMFGFLSPSIIQETEALDPDHRLVEYWNHKNGSNSLEIEDSIVSNPSMSITKGRHFGIDLNRT